MKVSWLLKNMTDVKTLHLKANLEYWLMDTVYEASKMLDRINKSRALKILGRSDNVKLMLEIAQAKGEITRDDIHNLINYDVVMHGDEVKLELFISPDYFQGSDIAKQQLGRGARMFKVMDRQAVIDGFEGEFSKLYTKDYCGTILEDDDKPLSITR